MRHEEAKRRMHSERKVLRLRRDVSGEPCCKNKLISNGCSDPLSSLLSEVAQGDRRSFEHLYRKSRPLLFTVARRVVGNPAIAEEVLQETYLTIWQKAHMYSRQHGAPTTWMSTLVRNKAIDRLRSQKRRREAATVPLDDIEHGLAADTAKDETRILDEQSLQQVMRLLSDRQLACLLLVYYQGMTHAEVAHKTNTPLGTVKTHIRKGLRDLRVSIEG